MRSSGVLPAKCAASTQPAFATGAAFARSRGFPALPAVDSA